MKTAARFGMLFLLFSLQISFSQINWQQTNGPYGGDVQAFALSGNNLFAGTFGDGIFISTNNGSSWSAVNTGLTNLNIQTLAVNGANLFAGTRDGGVFLSADNGTHWTPRNNGLTTINVWCLTASGTNLFAATDAGVFLSSNNGTSWSAVNTGLTNFNVQTVIVNGANLFAGAIGGVFLSTNNGTSWTSVSGGLTNTNVITLTVSGTNLFAGTEGGGIFRSTNNGTSWTAVNNGLTDLDIWSLAVSTNGAGGENIFAGSWDDGIFLSTNNGANWTAINTDIIITSINKLAVIPNGAGGTNLFAGTRGNGVFLSTNGGAKWTAASTGLAHTWIHSLTVSGTNLFAGNYNGGGVFLSTNNGTSWTAVCTGLPNGGVSSLAAFPNGAGGTNLFVGVYSTGVFLSTNNGTSWTAASTGLPTINVDVSDFALSGVNLFAGAWGDGVFLSTNNGTSWKEVNTGLTNKNVKALMLSGTNLFAGTYGGGVFLSTNNGTSWNAVNTGLTNTDVYALAVSPNGAGGSNIFAGTIGGGAFLSTNNGASWTAANTGLTDPGVQTFAVSGTNIFAGTDAGVFLSTNNGTSWAAVNSGLTNPYIFALAVSPAMGGSSAKLFAGTDAGGVFIGTMPANFAPSTPQNLIAAAGNNQLTLKWNKNTETDFLRYRIYRSTSPNPTIKVDSTTGGITDTIKVITGLTNGITYYFRITAVNSAGMESGYSNEVSMKPAKSTMIAIPDMKAPAAGSTVLVPINVAKFPDVGAITLWINYNPAVVTFVGVANANPGVSFTIGSNILGVIKLIWYDVTATTPINIDTGKLVDLKFTYVGGSCPLTFNTAQCEVANENVVPITGITYQNGSIVAVTPPAAPQNLIAVAGKNQVTLKWNKNTEPDFLRYRIYRSTSPIPIIKVDSTTGGIADTAKVITGITNSATYYFRITAVDSAGSESEYSNEVSTTGNQKPVFTAISPMTRAALDTVKFVVNATDPNVGDVLTYSVVGLPAGAKFDSTRTFFWIPTVAQYGSYKVSFLVSDGQLKDSMGVSITITMLNLCLKNPISDMTLTDAQRTVKVKLTLPPVFANNTGVLTYTTASANTVYVTASIIAPDTLKVQGWRSTPPDVGIRIRVTAIDTNQSTISTTFFVVDQGTTGIVDITTIPKEFSLSQNYPNPFNPSTNIEFNIPARSFVLLRVFDIMGREVATLINQETPAGTYQVTFDASQLPGGVYFYRLQARQTSGGQAGTFTGTKKLLLLK